MRFLISVIVIVAPHLVVVDGAVAAAEQPRIVIAGCPGFCSGDSELFLVRPDLGERKRLTYNGRHDGAPALSPNGKRVAYTCGGKGGHGDICLLTLRSGKTVRITSTPQPDNSPTWSPDGTQIAFEREVESVPQEVANMTEIYVMDVNGENVTRLTDDVTLDEAPEFSPDGSSLVFVSYSDGDSEITTLDIESGERKQLTSNDDLDRDPTWSRNGSRIAWVVGDGELHIYLMNADGSDPVIISERDAYGLDWATDSGRIAFTALEGEREILNILKVQDGSTKAVDLTRSWSYFRPDW